LFIVFRALHPGVQYQFPAAIPLSDEIKDLIR
jgi:hypothetical protein